LKVLSQLCFLAPKLNLLYKNGVMCSMLPLKVQKGVARLFYVPCYTKWLLMMLITYSSLLTHSHYTHITAKPTSKTFNNHLEDFKQGMSIDIDYCSSKIVEIADKTNLTVFLDLSSHSKQEQKYLIPFLEVTTQLLSCKNARVLLSISSGFRAVRRPDLKLKHLVTLLRDFEVFLFKWFYIR